MSGDFARTFRFVSQGGPAAGAGSPAGPGQPGRTGIRTGQRKIGPFVLGPRLFGDRRAGPFLARGRRSPRVPGARLRGIRRNASGKRCRGPLSPVLPWIGRQFPHGRGRQRRVFHDPAHRGGGGRGVLPTRFLRALKSPFWVLPLQPLRRPLLHTPKAPSPWSRSSFGSSRWVPSSRARGGGISMVRATLPSWYPGRPSRVRHRLLRPGRPHPDGAPSRSPSRL